MTSSATKETTIDFVGETRHRMFGLVRETRHASDLGREPTPRVTLSEKRDAILHLVRENETQE